MTMGTSQADFAAFIDKAMTRWDAVVKQVGIKGEHGWAAVDRCEGKATFERRIKCTGSRIRA